MHGHEPLLGTILVPVKPDRHFQLLPWVVALARGAGASLRFVWVHHGEVTEELASQAEDHLAEWMSRCAHVGVESSSEIRRGDLEDELVRAAIEVGADLVVLSHSEDSRRVDGLQHRLMHDPELRSPPCPVLLVPTCDHKDAAHAGPPTCSQQPFREETVEERSRLARETNPFRPSSGRDD